MRFMNMLPIFYDAPGSEGGASDNPENGGQNPPGSNGNGAGEDKPFGQADVDRIAAQAREQGRSKAVNDTLKALGFDDLDKAKAFFKDAKKRQEGDMSELERAQSRLAELEPAATERDQLKQQLEANDKAIEAYVKSLVKDLNIPKHVSELLDGMGPAERLDYIIKYREDFGRTAAPNIDAGAGGRGKGPTPDEIKNRKIQNRRYGRL